MKGVDDGSSKAASQEVAEAADQPKNFTKVFHPPKLERKHSSGDLHSRLKTRKVLGVGETDNGDIHRSKISQVLGHNEHLYVKFPKGFWHFHLLMAVGLTTQGLVLLLLPSRAHDLALFPELRQVSDDGLLAARFYGVALLGLSMMVWQVISTTDRAQVRATQVATVVYFGLLTLLSLLVALARGALFSPGTLFGLSLRLLMLVGSGLFYNMHM